MDAYSSSSKYDADVWIYGCALLISRRIWPVCLFAGSLFTFSPFSSTNSEEAKSTTWLHPVTGEAVVTGHRKTTGKYCGDVFFSTAKTRTLTHTCSAWERLSARHGGGGGRRGGPTSCGESGGRRPGGDFFSLQQSNSLPCSAALPSLLSSGGPLRTASLHLICPPLFPPLLACSLHLATLRHTF